MVLLGIIISYLLGSIPTAYIVGRIRKGIDIRNFGSGNVGATNAFRVLGPIWAIIVLTVDISKGLVSVTLLADYFLNYWDFTPLVLRILFGFACILGHNWTIFLRFKGGKGVATTLGVLAGLAVVLVELRLVILLVILVWLVAFLVFRVVSVASILCSIALPFFVFFFCPTKELLIFSIILALFIIIRHKNNIVGLLQGGEHPLTSKKQ